MASSRLPSIKLISRFRTLARVRPLVEGDLPEVAETVAIIMDGNGRWARRRGLPTAVGHRAGTRALRRTVEAGIELGIRNLVVYAFSTENWSRPQDEVDALMELFGETIERELPDLADQGVRVRFIGRRDRAPADLLPADGGDGGPHRAELAARPLDRVRLRRPGGARRGDAPDRRERDGSARDRRERPRGEPATRRTCPIPTC